jgi:hypothetical protein
MDKKNESLKRVPKHDRNFNSKREIFIAKVKIHSMAFHLGRFGTEYEIFRKD